MIGDEAVTDEAHVGVLYDYSETREVTLDRQSGSVYVKVRHAEVTRTVEMPTDGMGCAVNVDLDDNGIVVGVEIL